MQTRPMSLARFAAVAGMVGVLAGPAAALAAAPAGFDGGGEPASAQASAGQGDAPDNTVSVGAVAVEGMAEGSEASGAGGALPEGEAGLVRSEPPASSVDSAGSVEAVPDEGVGGADEAGTVVETPQAPSEPEGSAEATPDPVPSAAEPCGINVSAASTRVGMPLTVSAAFGEGDTQGCSYNYVWAKADWSQWSSTVREQGGYTTDASWSFCPTQAGSYILAVDVVRDGKVQTFSTTVEVRPAWVATGLSVKTPSPSAGSPVEVAVNFEAGSVTEGLSYNYVWMRDDWASWGSTVKDGLTVGEPSYSYSFYTPGAYTLYVDVTDAAGSTVTLSTGVQVGVGGYGLDVTLGEGAAVMAPVVPAGIEGFKFNYVWQLDGSWADGDWGSTVLETGGPTSETAWNMPLTRSGTYTLYLDVIGFDGTTIATFSRTVKSTGSASFSDISATSPAGSFKVGSPVDVSLAAFDGEAGRYKYNVVWALPDWSAWASTLTLTGDYSADASLRFVPTKPGTYLLYVDVVDMKTGEVKTLSSSIDVGLGWAVSGLSVSYPGLLTPSSTVTLEAQVQGDTEGLTYNYVWQGNGWANWNSTVRQGGASTAEPAGSFTLNGDKGFYEFYVDVTDAFGNTVTYGPQTVYASNQTGPVKRIYEVASTRFGDWNPEPFESAVLAAGAPLCYGQTGYFCGAFVWWSMEQAGYGDKFCDGNIIVEPRRALRYYQSRGLYDPDIRNVRAGDIVFARYTTNAAEYPADHIMYCLWADDEGYMAMDANNGPCGTRYIRFTSPINVGFGRVLY